MTRKQLQLVPVGDVLTKIPSQAKVKRSEYQPSGSIPIIDQGAAFVAGYISDPSRSYVGDLPIVVFGDHTRILKYVSFPFAVGADGTRLLRPTASWDVRYFYYCLLSLNLKNYGYERHFKYLKEERILYRPLADQLKVAAILSSYDDLIANNVRRTGIIEESARMLQVHWFGSHRKESEAKPFADLLESTLGGDWGSDTPTNEEDRPVVVVRGTDMSDVRTGGILRTPIRYISAASLWKRKLRNGDLIVENSVNAKTRCTGSTLLVTDGILRALGDDVIAASFCKVFRFKDPMLAPLGHLYMRYLYSEGKMAFYQNVAANGIGNFQSGRFVESEALVVPTNSQRLSAMLDMARDLTSSTFAEEIWNLRRTRDLLLPKLMSGEVNVPDLKTPEDKAV